VLEQRREVVRVLLFRTFTQRRGVEVRVRAAPWGRVWRQTLGEADEKLMASYRKPPYWTARSER
jgi:hypothetical protein